MRKMVLLSVMLLSAFFAKAQVATVSNNSCQSVNFRLYGDLPGACGTHFKSGTYSIDPGQTMNIPWAWVNWLSEPSVNGNFTCVPVSDPSASWAIRVFNPCFGGAPTYPGSSVNGCVTTTTSWNTFGSVKVEFN